jgi:hypothetical protein
MLRSLRSLRGSVRLGQSPTAPSHGSLHPHFCSPGLCCAKPLYGLQKRHIQPERYATYQQNCIFDLTVDYKFDTILKEVQND